ncbi:Uncharacterised protein [Bordetella pertussis]|nr:Uncharacterised protein [Bordetella pertussis]CFP69987.1 Uncharacterised protein [Bordetella pertussis]CFU80014.1 Uncharacterised protein [Bordetella pertussis]CFW48226.1 Uncharacterised protein [Bordetella pertussis]CPH73457.1 Uncharacterised protein [Bordetella pertussis]
MLVRHVPGSYSKPISLLTLVSGERSSLPTR